MHPWMNVFWAPKSDSAPAEYEDAATLSAGIGRLAVADGATEAYDARRWVDLLTRSFVVERPALDVDSMLWWIGELQHRWAERPAPERATIFDEERSRRSGAFGTFLGAELTYDRDRLRWHAVAVGDTVLFQVRGGHLVTTVPALAAEDFGYEPPLVHSSPDHLADVRASLVAAAGTLEADDVLLVATDALAHWALATAGEGEPAWDLLADMRPEVWHELVGALRRSRQLADDDTTLVVVRPDAVPAAMDVARDRVEDAR